MSPDFENQFEGFRPFTGAGVRRSDNAAAREHIRRLHDERLLERLERLGINGRAGTRATVTAVDLATEGDLVGTTKVEIRRWGIFQQNKHKGRVVAQARMRSWLSSRNPDDREGRRFIKLMLRPKGGPASVDQLAAHHMRLASKISEALRYAARRLGDEFVPLSYGIHHRPLQRGAFIDAHGHISADITDQTDLEWLRVYLSRQFEVFMSPHQINLNDGYEEAAAAYEIDLFDADQFSDENLCTYVTQHHVEHHLHRHQVLGPLREHVSALQRDGLCPILIDRNDGSAAEEIALQYRPATPRLPRQAMAPQWQAGPVVLAARLAWVGNELRPSLIVRNWSGDWALLTERYDVNKLVAAARQALGRRPASMHSLDTTVNPEQEENAAGRPMTEPEGPPLGTRTAGEIWTAETSPAGRPTSFPLWSVQKAHLFQREASVGGIAGIGPVDG